MCQVPDTEVLRALNCSLVGFTCDGNAEANRTYLGVIRAIEKQERVILHVIFSEAIKLKDLCGMNTLVRGSGIDVPISFLVRGSEVKLIIIYLSAILTLIRLARGMCPTPLSKQMKASARQSADLERISKEKDFHLFNKLIFKYKPSLKNRNR